MKILVLGATGPTGRHLLRRALADGVDVTVLVRRPEAVAELADRLDVVTGDATSRDDVAAAAEGVDVIVSALGRGTSMRSEGLFTRAARAVVDGARDAGVRRLVWLSSFGVGATYRDASLLQKAFYRTFLRDLYADKAASERIIRGSALDWSLVYPTALTHSPGDGAFVVGERLPMRGNPTISRDDVAAFLLQEAQEATWVRRDAVISGR